MKSKTSYRTGLGAEAFCRWALRLKGYAILARRYKTSYGEIDIIAARGRTIALIEVKARGDVATAMESVTPHQRRRVERAALDFQARHPRWQAYDMRFDVMLVIPYRWPRHLKNAWRAGE